MHKDSEGPKPKGKPYATDDVEFSVLGKSAILLLIFTLFSTALAGGSYYLFVVREAVHPAHVLEATPMQPDPNVPILQTDPVAEIHKFRADEYDAERSYAHWKDGDGKTSLRIPISRAMEIVKSKGLQPSAKPPTGAIQPAAPDVTNAAPEPAATVIQKPPASMSDSPVKPVGVAPVEPPPANGTNNSDATGNAGAPNAAGGQIPAAGTRK